MKTLEKQLDRQSTEKIQAQAEMEQMQSILDSLDPNDPKYVSVNNFYTLSRYLNYVAIKT